MSSSKIHFNDCFLPPNSSPLLQSIYGIVILNSENAWTSTGGSDMNLLRRIWKNMEFICCADGGANRLYDSLPEPDRGLFIPQFIAGDLDSIRDDVASFFRLYYSIYYIQLLFPHFLTLLIETVAVL